MKKLLIIIGGLFLTISIESCTADGTDESNQTKTQKQTTLPLEVSAIGGDTPPPPPRP